MPNKLRRLCCALLAAAAALCFPLAAGAYYSARVVSAGNVIRTGSYAPPTPENGVTVDGNTVTVKNSSQNYAFRLVVAQDGEEPRITSLGAQSSQKITLAEGQSLYILGQYQTLAGLGEHAGEYLAAAYRATNPPEADLPDGAESSPAEPEPALPGSPASSAEATQEDPAPQPAAEAGSAPLAADSAPEPAADPEPAEEPAEEPEPAEDPEQDAAPGDSPAPPEGAAQAAAPQTDDTPTREGTPEEQTEQDPAEAE